MALNEAVAAVAADAAVEDVKQMFVALGAEPALGASYDAAPPRDFARTVTFYDAAGDMMDAYDAELTASINIVVTASGTVEREGWTATVSRNRDMTVSGLAGPETSRTWNGTGSGAVTGSRHTDEHGDRSYDMDTLSHVRSVSGGL